MTNEDTLEPLDDASNDNATGDSNSLSPGELQLLMAYFTFSRQGRAMSFYFPRMGRSDHNSSNSGYCCAEGVRRVFTVGKGTLEICASEKTCCPGFSEQTKVYKDIIIT